MNTKRKTNNILVGFLIAIFICVGTSVFSLTKGILTPYASTYAIDRVSYEKHTAVIEDDFAGDRIIVTLKPEYSGINKSISMQNFKTPSVMTAQCPGAENVNMQIGESSNLDVADKSEVVGLTEKSNKIINKSIIESITDLTQMKNPSKIIKKDSFMQILSI